jgi:hypothetical protein
MIFLIFRVEQNLLKNSILCYITPYSPSNINRRYEETCRLQLQGRRKKTIAPASCLSNFSTLKMEEKFSSETSVDFQLTTRRYSPENRATTVWNSDPTESALIKLIPEM